MEFVTLWGAMAPHDLPSPIAEYRFHPTRRWRFDYAWPGPRGGVAMELDGGQWMAGGGRHNTDGDREKLNVAAALGWRVLRFSPRALADDPAGCVALIVAALVFGVEVLAIDDLATYSESNARPVPEELAREAAAWGFAVPGEPG